MFRNSTPSLHMNRTKWEAEATQLQHSSEQEKIKFAQEVFETLGKDESLTTSVLSDKKQYLKNIFYSQSTSSAKLFGLLELVSVQNLSATGQDVNILFNAEKVHWELENLGENKKLSFDKKWEMKKEIIKKHIQTISRTLQGLNDDNKKLAFIKEISNTSERHEIPETDRMAIFFKYFGMIRISYARLWSPNDKWDDILPLDQINKTFEEAVGSESLLPEDKALLAFQLMHLFKLINESEPYGATHYEKFRSQYISLKKEEILEKLKNAKIMQDFQQTLDSAKMLENTYGALQNDTERGEFIKKYCTSLCAILVKSNFPKEDKLQISVNTTEFISALKSNSIMRTADNTLSNAVAVGISILQATNTNFSSAPAALTGTFAYEEQINQQKTGASATIVQKLPANATFNDEYDLQPVRSTQLKLDSIHL